MAAWLRAFPWLAHLPLPSVQAQGDIKAAVEPMAQDVIETAKRNANTSSIKGKDLLSILRKSQASSWSVYITYAPSYIQSDQERWLATT